MTEHPVTQHLTEEEFADYLLGLSSDATRTHLLECGACREEMESFGASLASFNQSSLAWSREQAAAQQMHIEVQTGARRAKPQFGWQAGWAAAAALVFAVALLHGHAGHNTVASNQKAPVAAVAVTPVADSSEIAEDNQMMAAIDAEISRPEVSPVELFATFRPQHTSVQDGQHAVRGKS
jgi:anti-sigma factor RsiW